MCILHFKWKKKKTNSNPKCSSFSLTYTAHRHVGYPHLCTCVLPQLQCPNKRAISYPEKQAAQGQSSTGTSKKREGGKKGKKVFSQDRINHYKPDRGEYQRDVPVMRNSHNAVPPSERTKCTMNRGWRRQRKIRPIDTHCIYLTVVIYWHNPTKSADMMAYHIIHFFHLPYYLNARKKKNQEWSLHFPAVVCIRPACLSWLTPGEKEMSNIIFTCLVNLHWKPAQPNISSWHVLLQNNILSASYFRGLMTEEELFWSQSQIDLQLGASSLLIY